MNTCDRARATHPPSQAQEDAVVQVAQAWGEVPVARAQDEIALISRASESSSEWLDDVGVRGRASSSIHASTVLSDIDSVHDMTDQSSAAKADIVVISMGKAPEEAHQKFESPPTAMAGAKVAKKTRNLHFR